MSFALVGRVSGTGRFGTAAIHSGLADNLPKALLNSAETDLHRPCSASSVSWSDCPKPDHHSLRPSVKGLVRGSGSDAAAAFSSINGYSS